MERWLAGESVWTHDKILKEWGPNFEMYRRRWNRGDFSLNLGVERFQLRDEWIEKFGFAIPCAELLDELARAAHVIEVGAGSGYMTRLMRHRGIRVTGSDPCHGDHGFETGAHDDEQVKASGKTMVRRYPRSTVFCSWPTLRATWFRQMLKAMGIGQRLVVIREGACAEESAWQYLDDCFDETAVIDIPAFAFMHDYASVHVKKRQTNGNG
jgi:hypothetical protein